MKKYILYFFITIGVFKQITVFATTPRPLYYTDLYSDPNLIAYYRFEDNGNATVGTNGTTTNITWGAGKFATGSVNTAGYLTIGDVANLRFTKTSPFSLGCWVKTSDTSNYMKISGKQDSVSNGEGYNLMFSTNTSASKLRFEMVDTTGSKYIRADGNTTVLRDGNYHLLAATYDGSGANTGIELYVDGNPETETRTGSTPLGTVENGNPFVIGARESGNQPLTGNMDDCWVFNDVLTAAEILKIAQGGWCSITSFTPTEGYSGSAVTFTGTGFTPTASIKIDNITLNNQVYTSATTFHGHIPDNANSDFFTYTDEFETCDSSTEFSVNNSNELIETTNSKISSLTVVFTIIMMFTVFDFMRRIYTKKV